MSAAPGFKKILFSAALFLSPSALWAGGVLRVCDDVKEPASLNPYAVFSEKTHTIIQQMLEGLVRFNAQGKIVPALAERWKRIDKDTMRFYLRPGVFFHDGEPFDAAAVKFSIEKYVNPKTAYPGAAFTRPIERVEIIDGHTVDVITDRPDGLLLNRLAAWVYIVAPKYFQKVGPQGFSKRPVGTGPFMFERWDKGEKIVLSAYENYWRRGYPKLDGVEFHFLPTAAQVNALLSGHLDLVTELPGTETERVASSGVARVLKKKSFYTVAMTFNFDGPLKDRRVRQALNYAIDRRSLIRYDLMGNGVALATLTMPGEIGHDRKLKVYPYDPEKARKLLKQAGYADGLKLRAFAKVQGERAAKIIRKQLSKVGVDVYLVIKTDADIPAAIHSKKWDFAIGGCPDPMAHSFFISSIFLYSKSPYALGGDAQFDHMLEDMAATINPDAQRRKAEKMDDWIHDQALSLFTYQRIKTYGVRKGIQIDLYVTGMPFFVAARKTSLLQANAKAPDAEIP